MECKLFRDMSEEEQHDILKCAGAVQKEFRPGEYIFRLGDHPSKMYLVKKGQVMIARDFASGRRNVLFTVFEGEVFGDPFSFDKDNETWSDAIAHTAVTVIEIPWDFIHGFCKNACPKHQIFIKNMLEIMSDKNRRTIRKLYLLSGKTIRERVAMWLMVGSKGRNYFTSCMNKEELADFLGVTRPSLSREMSLMMDEGLFESDRRTYRILNRAVLEELAEL